MKRNLPACAAGLALAWSGCAQPPAYFSQYSAGNPPPAPLLDAQGNPLSRAELLPDGRWVKKIDIRSEPWGARIMVGGYYMGETPMEVPIPCTPAGRFTRSTRIRLIPNEAEGRVHSDFFPAGSRVPSRLYFSATAIAPR